MCDHHFIPFCVFPQLYTCEYYFTLLITCDTIKWRHMCAWYLYGNIIQIHIFSFECLLCIVQIRAKTTAAYNVIHKKLLLTCKEWRQKSSPPTYRYNSTRESAEEMASTVAKANQKYSHACNRQKWQKYEQDLLLRRLSRGKVGANEATHIKQYRTQPPS